MIDEAGFKDVQTFSFVTETDFSNVSDQFAAFWLLREATPEEKAIIEQSLLAHCQKTGKAVRDVDFLMCKK